MAAYLYAEAAPDDIGRTPPLPNELETLRYIDRFGVKAVLGRDVLAYHEIVNMTYAESIVKSYQSRQQSGDWGKWTENHPHNSATLMAIEKQLNAEN